MEDILDTFAGTVVAIIIALGIVIIFGMFVDKATRRVGNDYVQYRYADCVANANANKRNGDDCALIRDALIGIE